MNVNRDVNACSLLHTQLHAHIAHLLVIAPQESPSNTMTNSLMQMAPPSSPTCDDSIDIAFRVIVEEDVRDADHHETACDEEDAEPFETAQTRAEKRDREQTREHDHRACTRIMKREG